MDFFKWCKKHGMDSSNGNYTIKLGRVKEYNT
jgi:hypothetical protein